MLRSGYSRGIPGVLDKPQPRFMVVLRPGRQGVPGAAYAKAPYKGRNKPQSQKDANKAHAKLRAPGERMNAQPKS